MKDLFKLYDSTIFFESSFLDSLINEPYSIDPWNDGSGNHHSIFLDGPLFSKIRDNLKAHFIKDILYAINYSYQEPQIEGKFHIDDCPRNEVLRQCSLVFPIQNSSPTYFKEDGNIYECEYGNNQCALINVQRTHRAVNYLDTRRVTMQISFTKPFSYIKSYIDNNINNYTYNKGLNAN
jgi:hypothetical protein